MSKFKKFLEELLKTIKTDPNLPAVAIKIDSFLKESTERTAKYKKWANRAAMIATIIYSILSTIGLFG